MADLHKVKQELEAAKTEFETAQRRQPQYPTPHKGVPHVKSGPIGGESRPFSLTKAIGARLGHIDEDQAKDDLHTVDMYRKAIEESGCALAALGSARKTMLIPLHSGYLPTQVYGTKSYAEYKSRTHGTADQADPDEINYLIRKSNGFAPHRKDMSYLTDASGGTLVAPPVQGDLIELIRPIEALMNAGAMSVPLPPNGRIAYPRVTSSSSAYWLGENTSITESQLGTGQVTLTAKKVASYVEVPNELFKFASVATDAMIRSDMAKTLSLAFDYDCLYGPGGTLRVKGLISYTGTDQLVDYAGLTPAPKGIAVNGNILRPEDGYRLAGIIEDRFNEKFDGFGWIMRPSMANNVLGYRADAAAPADAAGGFVQGLMRAVNDKLPTNLWSSYPVTKSSVVRGNQTKGGGTALTEVFGGIWSYFMLGMYGAVEIATSSEAGNTFQNDQTALRAIMHCDAAPRHEGAFGYYKQLVNSTN